jgi:preprotein translocase subunit SecE
VSLYFATDYLLKGESEMEDAAKSPVSQPENKAAKKDKNDGFNFGRYCKELKGEFKKIIWPNGKQLGRETVTVIVLSLLVGIIIFIVDQAFGFGYNHLITFVQGLFS